MHSITINKKETMNLKNCDIYVGGFEVRKGMENILKFQSQYQTKKEKRDQQYRNEREVQQYSKSHSYKNM